MKIKRYLLSQLREAITPGKVIILYGPRQVVTERKAHLINADELRYREALASRIARS